jgi:Glycosyltransferase family 87
MTSRPSPARRALRDGLVVAGLLFGAYLFVIVAPRAGTVGFDAFAYWNLSINDPYATHIGGLGSFLYTPVLARLFAPATNLDWPTFLWLWLAVLLATAIWLGGRRRWLWVLALPPVALELYHGNIHLLMAAAIALGFRYPATWAFVLLAKVTPGVGLLWFLVRREWRNLAIALGVTAAIVAVSLAVDFRLWVDWLDRQILGSLQTAPNQPHIDIPLLLRLPAAALLVVWGARTDRKWTVPLAAAIAMPVLWIAAFSVAAAALAADRPELQPKGEQGRHGTTQLATPTPPATSAMETAR